MRNSHSLARSLVTTTVVGACLAGALQAQQVTVSSPTKTKDEGVTVKVNDGGENVTLSNFTGKQGTKPEEKADDLPAKMDPKKKAERIAEAINNAPENTRENGTKRVNATTDGDKVNVAGTSSDVKVEMIKVNSNTGEKSDKLKWEAEKTMFSATVLGSPTLYDGCGDAAIFRLGTARGVVEIPLASTGSVHATLVAAADGLAQHGIVAWLPTPNSIAFEVDPELDECAHFGCSDFGLEQVVEMAELADGSGDDATE